MLLLTQRAISLGITLKLVNCFQGLSQTFFFFFIKLRGKFRVQHSNEMGFWRRFFKDTSKRWTLAWNRQHFFRKCYSGHYWIRIQFEYLIIYRQLDAGMSKAFNNNCISFDLCWSWNRNILFDSIQSIIRTFSAYFVGAAILPFIFCVFRSWSTCVYYYVRINGGIE